MVDIVSDGVTLLSYSSLCNPNSGQTTDFENADAMGSSIISIESPTQDAEKLKTSILFKDRNSIRESIRCKLWYLHQFSRSKRSLSDGDSTKYDKDSIYETSSIYSDIESEMHKSRSVFINERNFEALRRSDFLEPGSSLNCVEELESSLPPGKGNSFVACSLKTTGLSNHPNSHFPEPQYRLKTEGLIHNRTLLQGQLQAQVDPSAEIAIKHQAEGLQSESKILGTMKKRTVAHSQEQQAPHTQAGTDIHISTCAESRDQKQTIKQNEVKGCKVVQPEPDIIIYKRVRRHRIRLWKNKYLPEDSYKGSITELRISKITARILDARHRAGKIASEAALFARRRNTHKAIMFSCAIAAATFSRLRYIEKMPGASHGSLATEYMTAAEQVANVSLTSRFYNKDYQKLRAKFHEHFQYKNNIDYFRAIIPIPVEHLDKKSGAYQMYVRMRRIPRPPILDHTVIQFHLDRLTKKHEEFDNRRQRFLQETGIKRIKIDV